MRLIARTLVLLVLMVAPSFCQTSTPPPTTTPPPSASPTAGPFTITAGTATFSVKGQQVAVATITGLLNLSPNLRLRDDNLLAPDVNYSAFLGGMEYSWLHLIKKSTLSTTQWDAYAVAEGGASRVVPPTGAAVQHFGLYAGGGLRYDPTGMGHFSMTIAEVGVMRAPGLAGGVVPTFRSSINWNLGKN
jgi:hypothetical protein